MKTKSFMAFALVMLFVVAMLPSAFAASQVTAYWTAGSSAESLELLQGEEATFSFLVYGYDGYDIYGELQDSTGAKVGASLVDEESESIENVLVSSTGYGYTLYQREFNSLKTSSLDGDYAVYVEITDTDGSTDSYQISLSVDADSDGDGVGDDDDVCEGHDDNGADSDGDGMPDACDTPSITQIADFTMAEGESITLTLDGVEPNDDETLTLDVAYSSTSAIHGTLLSGTVSISDSQVGDTLYLTIEPDYNFITHTSTFDEFTVIVTAEDSSEEASTSFTVSVEDTNQLPSIDSTPSETANEGLEYEYQIEVEDLDTEDVAFGFNYAVVSGPSDMSVDSNGLVTWTPDFDEEGNTYTVTLSVEDVMGGIDYQTFSLTVDNSNREPVLTLPADLDITEGEEVGLDNALITADDDDGDALTISATGLPTGATLEEYDVGAVYIRWATGSEDAGVYPITIEVTDGDATVSGIFTINVHDDGTTTNNAPELFVPEDPLVYTEGENVELIAEEIRATDADGDDIVLTADNLPEGAVFTDNEDGTAHFEWATDSEDAGEYAISVTADDGTDATTEIFTIVVEDNGEGGNNNPIISSIDDQTVFEGDLLEVEFTVTDADADEITFAVEGNPIAVGISDKGDGNYLFSLETEVGHASEYPEFAVTITAEDGNGGSDEESFTVNIVEQVIIIDDNNNAPSLTADPESVIVTEGEDVKVTVTGFDLDYDDLTFSTSGLPEGAIFTVKSDGVTGTLWWETTTGDAGEYTVTVTVNDGTDSTSLQIPITVDADPSAGDAITVTSEGLALKSVHVSDEEVRAGDYVYVSVGMENQAQRDLEDLKVSVVFYDFATKVTTSEFDLDDGEEMDKSLSVSIPRNVREGLYYMKVTVSNDEEIDAVAYRTIRVE